VTWSAAQAAATTTFTLSAATYAINAVQVRQTDVAGNVTATSSKNTAAITVDTTAPTVKIESDSTSLIYSSTTAETATIKFTFSEAPTSFSSSNVTVTGGSLATGSFDTATGKIYSAVFTPDGTGVVSFAVAAGAFSDPAGNASTAAATDSTNISVAYTVISSDDYVTGATVFLDVNGDGTYNTGDIAGTETTTTGSYSFSVPKTTVLSSSAKIYSTGGTDTVSTATPSTTYASLGSAVVSSTSTSYASATTDAAKAAVLKNAGFEGDLASFVKYDPAKTLANSTDSTVLEKAAKVLAQNQTMLVIVKNVDAVVEQVLIELQAKGVVFKNMDLPTATARQEVINKVLVGSTGFTTTDYANLTSKTVGDKDTFANGAIQKLFGLAITAAGAPTLVTFANLPNDTAFSLEQIAVKGGSGGTWSTLEADGLNKKATYTPNGLGELSFEYKGAAFSTAKLDTKPANLTLTNGKSVLIGDLGSKIATAIARLSTKMMTASDSATDVKDGSLAAFAQLGMTSMATDLATLTKNYLAVSDVTKANALITKFNASYGESALPTAGEGMNLLQALTKVNDYVKILVTTGKNNNNVILKATDLGAIDDAIGNAVPLRNAKFTGTDVNQKGLLFKNMITNPQTAIGLRDLDLITLAKGFILGDDITMMLSKTDFTDKNGAKEIALRFGLAPNEIYTETLNPMDKRMKVLTLNSKLMEIALKKGN
jgi:hypothetical protein